MRKARPRTTSPNEEQLLLDRARRSARRGEARKTRVLLREACFRTGDDPRLWAMYGACCFQAGERDEALRAFKQSLWLRKRRDDEPRARVLRALVEQIEGGAVGVLRAA